MACFLHKRFLDDRHLFGGDFDPQIAPRHHDRIGSDKDIVDIAYRFRFFDLGNDRYLPVGVPGDFFPKVFYIFRTAHKG